MLPSSVSGSGEITLLFLHYFGGSRVEWDAVVGGLEGRFRCVAADAPGFGQARGMQGYTVEEMTQQVLALIRSLGDGPVVLVGHSMMGKVGIVVASRAPKNLFGLVLVAPSPLEPEPMTEEARTEMVAARETEDGAKKFFLKGAKSKLSEAVVKQGTEDVLRSHATAWRRWPQSGSREDWAEAIPPLAIPALLVVGELDEAIPLEFQSMRTMSHLKDARLEVIRGVGHLLPYEAPERLVELIAEFVDGLK